MTIATIVYALVFGSLVALAAAAIDGLFRLGKRPTRGVWAAALVVTLAGTALAPLRAAQPSLALPPLAGIVPMPAPPTPSLVDRVAEPFAAAREFAARAVDAALDRIPAARSARLSQWVFAGWVAASVLLLAVFAAIHTHFCRARRTWPQATVDGTTVRLAPLIGPAVIGLVKPEIVVPAWIVSRASAERHLVLDHEREHLEARDPLLLAGAYAAAALVPWHPVVWWMVARLRLAVELDCDARVLRHGVAPRRYGALLIDLAAQHPAVFAGVPVLGLTLTNLERRLIAMTPDRRPFTFARRGVLAAAALVACAMACEAPVPTADTASHAVDGARAGTATLAWKQPAPNGDSITYHVDGVVASKAAADSLQANDVPRYMTVRSFVATGMRRKVEYRIVTDSARAHAASTDAFSSGASVSGTPLTLEYRITSDSARTHEQTSADSSLGRSMSVSSGPAASERKIVAAAATEHDSQHFTGLVLIDGVVSSTVAFKTLSPDRIDRIDVFKGNQARQFSDPRAANGVISITTKKP